MKLFLYSFPGRFNISNQVLKPLKQNITTQCKLETYQTFHSSKIRSFIEKVDAFDPDVIIGLGSYRKNAKQLRLETKFTNQFGKQKIAFDGPNEFIIDRPTQLSRCFALGTYAGNSQCNFSGYSLLNHYKDHSARPSYYFIHIPRSLEINKVVENLQQFIELTLTRR